MAKKKPKNYSNAPLLTNSQVQGQNNYIGQQIDNGNSIYDYTQQNINNHYTNGNTINTYPLKYN